MKKIPIVLFILGITAIFSCSNTTSSEFKKEASAEGENKEVIEKINTAIFKEKVFNFETNKEWKYAGQKPCIVDFYADWCGPCKMIGPYLEELAAKYKNDIIIYKVNIDQNKDIAGAFGISSIPSVLFCPIDGKPTMATGALPKEEYEKAIKQILLKK